MVDRVRAVAQAGKARQVLTPVLTSGSGWITAQTAVRSRDRRNRMTFTSGSSGRRDASRIGEDVARDTKAVLELLKSAVRFMR